MLSLRKIRENPEEIEYLLRTRNDKIRLDGLLDLDSERRKLIKRAENLKHKKNVQSEKIARLKQSGKEDEASEIIDEMKKLSFRIRKLDGELKEKENQLNALLSELPNLPHPSVPVSDKEEDKKILKEYKEPKKFDFNIKNHLELGEDLGILDFPRGAKITGSRFTAYKGWGARLEMTLIYWMFTHQVEENGYEPIFPPFLANSESMYTSSQLPKFVDDLYHCGRDDLYLNPTAEVLLANMHRDEILDADKIPLNYVAYTACFRREAGGYGEEERGLIRTHQFNKVELFKFTTSDNSYHQLENMVEDAEDILKKLDLHYRLTQLPTCDLAQQAALTYDLEVWIPSQEKYYEVSSLSNCEDFQARRGNIRYRPEKGAKPEYLHTINGSGLATSRLFVALLENNQQKDGSVVLPPVLAKYLGIDRLK